MKLEFKFANQVTVYTWDRQEVVLKASVSIDDGEHDDLYEIEAVRSGTLEFYSNGVELRKKWRTIYNSNDCCKSLGSHMEINIEVQMPEDLDLDFNSISGNIKVGSLTRR